MQVISNFINQWLGTALPQLFLLFLGILLVILVVTALWDRRINRLGGIFGLLIGLFMASIALEESIAAFIGGLDSGVRVRLIAVLFSLCLLILTGTAWIKTGLQKRYGLTWTAVALIVLFTALFPDLLRSFPSLLGVHYGIALAGLFIGFLLLLVFHFSITISELYANQQTLLERIKQLERREDTALEQPVGPKDPVKVEQKGLHGLLSLLGKKLKKLSVSLIRRPERGTSLGAPLIILVAVCSVFLVGISTPQVMVGDEVTHYYMLKTQADVLPQPNFIAEIPTGWGETEVRRYPHSFGWHYLGAVIYKLTGGSFAAIQLYQALFLAQFLGVAYLLARSRRGVQTRSALPYLLILTTVPMTLIFSVTFYQDIPMTAQVLTAFYLLRQNRWLLATFFLGFALAMKVTAVLFFPAFFICLLIWTAGRCHLRKTVLICCCSLLVISSCTWGLGRAINVYAGASFYPLEKLYQIVHIVQEKINPVPQKKRRGKQLSAVKQQDRQPNQDHEPVGNTTEDQAKVISEQQASIIANHPGDLRIKANYFVYGGLLLWLLIIVGGAGALLSLLHRRGKGSQQPVQEKAYWLWGTGLSYTLLVALLLKSTPDARFFLPGLPFLLLPIAEQTVCLPRPKWVISLLASLALLQGGYVLSKTYKLRQVSPELKEGISWLQKHPPYPAKVFMYPEGNYRLFPVPHEWYMNYHLREFWRADNDLRRAILRNFNIGAVVIKKHLIAPVDQEITNLGVYPDYFVQEIEQDDRFHTVFENKALRIIRVVQVPGVNEPSQKPLNY
ncbi:DUF2304 family protein [Candidatus Electrothrix sp.]|uniref:DUF2304 family protein n=1 Tax=Candidatus Electrothrix sp. TaxID=2170559 RepID=UPI004055C259